MSTRKTLLAITVLALPLLTACTSETYTTGDGKYSNMRADFAEARTNASGELFCAVTDDGDSLVLSPRPKTEWATTPDSLYRALIYYNVPETGNEVKPLFTMGIAVPKIHGKNAVKKPAVDPVMLRSAWASRRGRYVNLGLAIKTGSKDGLDKKQEIGLMCDSITTGDGGQRRFYLKLLHRQNGVPEYYSAELFLCIADYRLPVAPAAGDEITIGINTYDGMVTKSFIYGQSK